MKAQRASRNGKYSQRRRRRQKEIMGNGISLKHIDAPVKRLANQPSSCRTMTRVAKGSFAKYSEGEASNADFRGVPMANVNLTTDLPLSQEWKDILEEILPPQGCWNEDQYLLLTHHKTRLGEFPHGFLYTLPRPTH